MKRHEVSAVLAILHEVYPRRIGGGDTATTVDVWSVLLADADPRQILLAATTWARGDNPHPPTPGALLALCATTERLTAGEAWGKVRAAIQHVGYGGSPDLDDLTRKAIEAVGGPWEAMCKSLQSNEITALRARFIEAYDQMDAREALAQSIGNADAVLELARPIARQYAIGNASGGKDRRQPN